MERLNIYQKLAKIRKPVEVLQKNKQGYGYRYVTEDLILSKITGLMNKYNISLIPNITPGTTVVTPYTYSKTKVTKEGKTYEENVNEILVSNDMTWSWVNNDDPDDRIVVNWSSVGQQSDASQAFGSGLSYSSRYFLLKYFNVATPEDDPDSWRSAQQAAAQSEEKEIAKGIIDQVHEIVMNHLEQHPDDRDKVGSVVKKYAKEKGRSSMNYYAISDPGIASALLEEITKQFAQ